jgi:glycosyltransferase involved in cell wall biosynthesis
MPAVTVIIPAFNAARYIGAALGSITEQTLRDIEVIIVDDGSSDETIREAQRYAASLDLTILQQGNLGPAAARNAGIRRARGRYCALLDADDLMLPELLATGCALLDASPGVGLVVSDIITFDDKGTIHEGHWKLSAKQDALERLLIENFITTSAVMARTRCLIEAGLFPEHRRVAEDYELWLNMATRWRVLLVDRPLVRYRYTAGSLSSDKLYSARCALDVIESFWRQHPQRRSTHPQIYRRSLARHRRNAGTAALAEGARLTALRYLLTAIRREPGAPETWKVLLKTLLPSRRHRRGSHSNPVRIS